MALDLRKMFAHARVSAHFSIKNPKKYFNVFFKYQYAVLIERIQKIALSFENYRFTFSFGCYLKAFVASQRLFVPNTLPHISRNINMSAKIISYF